VYDKQNPFKEVFIHYGFAKFPIFALTNWGEADPIVDFVKSLRQSREGDDWRLANKLEPKMRVFIPVIVRGDEAAGVRLWEVGVGIYKNLIAIAEDEDFGDYTDINEGRDFTVTATEGEVAGRKAVTCTIQIKPKQTVLSSKKEEVEKWLVDQPNILEINERYKQTYDGLKEILQKFLNPEAETEDNTISTIVEDEEEEEDLSSGNTLPGEVPKVKTTNAGKFDNLFKD
jgi:hypothetical protein